MATIFNIFKPIFKLFRTLKMVAIPVFMMLRIAIKALGKLRFIIPSAIITSELPMQQNHLESVLLLL